MTKLAAALTAIASLGAAAALFWAGVVFSSGERVYWEIRGPLWGLGFVVLVLGAFASVLAHGAED
jgi:hypothetical protein